MSVTVNAICSDTGDVCILDSSRLIDVSSVIVGI